MRGHFALLAEGLETTALATAAQALDALRADLAGLGGVVQTSATQRVPLTRLARSATSHAEFDFDKNGRHRTGRTVAVVRMTVEIRDFDLLGRLGSLLATHSAAHVDRVHWSVDAHNPHWCEVRAAAIEAAIQWGPRLRGCRSNRNRQHSVP